MEVDYFGLECAYHIAESQVEPKPDPLVNRFDDGAAVFEPGRNVRRHRFRKHKNTPAIPLAERRRKLASEFFHRAELTRIKIQHRKDGRIIQGHVLLIFRIQTVELLYRNNERNSLVFCRHRR